MLEVAGRRLFVELAHLAVRPARVRPNGHRTTPAPFLERLRLAAAGMRIARATGVEINRRRRSATEPSRARPQCANGHHVAVDARPRVEVDRLKTFSQLEVRANLAPRSTEGYFRAARARLAGAGVPYAEYRELVALRRAALIRPGHDEFGVADPHRAELGSRIRALEVSVAAKLSAIGFRDLAAFEEAIDDYLASFATEGVRVGLELLARYEMFLDEQARRYRSPEAIAELDRAIEGSGAREAYREACEQQALADSIHADGDSGNYLHGDLARKIEHSTRAREARARAEKAMRSIAAAHPMIDAAGLDLRRLATVGEGLRGVLTEEIRARREAIAETREHLDPESVFAMDMLLDGARASLGIEESELDRALIHDRGAAAKLDRAFVKTAVGVIGAAAGIVSAGTGALAAAASAVAIGAGTYSAIEEYREHSAKSAAYLAELSSDDPSHAWVIVALAGAGLDVIGARSLMQAMRGALDAFETTGDVAQLEASLAKLSRIGAELRRNVVRSAEAQRDFRAAARAAISATGGIQSVAGAVDPKAIAKLAEALYHLVRRGALTFEKFLLELRADQLIADLAALSPEELASLRKTFDAANRAVAEVAEHGKTLAMSEDEINAFLRYWGDRESGWSVEDLKDAMVAWAAKRDTGIPFCFRDAEHMEEFKALAAKHLKKAKYGDAEPILQGSSITGVSQSRKLPFRADSDVDLALASPTLFRRAERLREDLKNARIEIGTNPLRIGPIDPRNDGHEEILKELGLWSFQGALHRSAGRDVPIMLFKDRDAAFRWWKRSMSMR